METYRVKMNNTLSYPEYQDSSRPKKVSFHHIQSNSLAEAIQTAESKYAGKCEMASLKRLTSKSLAVKDMLDYENYEVLADECFTNDTAIFQKIKTTITVTLRGGEFTEKGTRFWFDLSIFDFTKGLNHSAASSPLSLSDLEALSYEIYQVIVEEQIPGIFKGKMDRIRN